MKEPNTICNECGKKFYKIKSRKSKSGLFFCSRVCKDKAQSFSGNCPQIRPSHYINGSCNYTDYAKKHLPNICNRCKFNEIPEILEVHHIDRDRTNNHISNLEILCPNCHQIEHFKTKTGRYC